MWSRQAVYDVFRSQVGTDDLVHRTKRSRQLKETGQSERTEQNNHQANDPNRICDDRVRGSDDYAFDLLCHGVAARCAFPLLPLCSH